MTIAAGRNGARALAVLRVGRRVGFATQQAEVRRDWRRFLSRRRLPATGDRRVTEVAKRSLITVRLARVADTGAIVASANTQGPYGEDWIRDGAFINRLLDTNGLTGWVTQHNLFYARVQTSPRNPSALRPSGNWPMASYFDGVDGAPIAWEIDETGLGIWTLFDHFHYLHGAGARRYLAEVYPAITRAADFLTACEDPTNGLQCSANEDDNYTKSQTLHGAGPVELGLQSAISAAAAVGDHSPRVTQWRRRLGRLRAAIVALYDRSTRSYRIGGNSAHNAYLVEYGDGGWLLWPVHFKAYRDPTMVGEANAVYAAMRRSLAARRRQYESQGAARARLCVEAAEPRPPACSAERPRLHRARRHDADRPARRVLEARGRPTTADPRAGPAARLGTHALLPRRSADRREPPLPVRVGRVLHRRVRTERGTAPRLPALTSKVASPERGGA